jgi:aminomethyltransferase
MEHPADLKKTPFADAYGKGVVEWMDVFGYGIPVTWGDVRAEYDALRIHAAAMEFSMLLKFDVTGPGALDTVNRVYSRDVSGMAAGKIAYGCVVTQDGMMVDDCTVFVHGPDHVRVIGAHPEVGDFLAGARSPGVTITERRDELAQLSVQGPKSRQILQRMTATDLSNAGLPYYSFVTGVDLAGIPAQISRIGFTGELGFELMIPVDRAADLWAALVSAGRDDGLLPAGGAVVMTARIEAGLIMGGLEFDEQTSPYECRLGWAVDLDKPDFQGKAALARLKGSPSTRVVTVVIDGPEQDYSFSTLRSESRDVGAVTIAVPSFYLGGRILGLAKVQVDHAVVGTVLEIGDQGMASAEIVKMPVYDPERVRVRS